MAPRTQFALVPVRQLRLGPNIRRDPGDLTELVDSIRQVGVLEPLIAVPSRDKNTIEVLAGQRRLAAAKIVGLTEVPCVLRARPEPREWILMQLAENFVRADMSPIDEAEAYEGLRRTGLTLNETGLAVRRSVTHVQSRLNLLKLPPALRDAVHERRLSTFVALSVPRVFFEDKAALKRLTMISDASVRAWAQAEHRRRVDAGEDLRVTNEEHAVVNLRRRFVDAAKRAARAEGISLARWMEKLIVDAVGEVR